MSCSLTGRILLWGANVWVGRQIMMSQVGRLVKEGQDYSAAPPLCIHSEEAEREREKEGT